VQAWHYARNLDGDDVQIHASVESGKKRYVGFELPGRTLGVIGLGAIGVKVANAALDLEMNVLGFDPQITVERAWQLSSSVDQAATIDELFSRCQFVTLHVPMIDATRNLVNAVRLASMPAQSVILNFSRDGVVAAAERDIIELVIAAAQAVVGAQSQIDTQLVLQTLERASQRLGSQNALRVRVSPTDASLVQATLGGDADAYTELVHRYQAHVYGLAYSLTSSWAEAQDVAQETFIRVHSNLDHLRDPERFAPWLRRVTFSVAMNWLASSRLSCVPVSSQA